MSPVVKFRKSHFNMASQAVHKEGEGTSKKQRFSYTLEKDLVLLESTLNINPFQLGTEKWNDVASNMSERFGYDVSARSVRDRVSNLLGKYGQEQLKVRTGSEEEKTRMGDLLKELEEIRESESRPINLEVGAEDEISVEGSSIHSKRQERMEADKERDYLLNSTFPDVPPDTRSCRLKRTRAAMEEDLLMEKCKQDIELERKRFELEETVRISEVENESQRIKLEFKREERLADEAKQRMEFMDIMKQMLELARRNT